MKATSLRTLTFPGGTTQRGCRLYGWRVKPPKGELLYVGRTGDKFIAKRIVTFRMHGA